MAVKPISVAARGFRALLAIAVSFTMLLMLASLAAAQKDKKKKKDANAANTHTLIPMSDEQQIDYRISELLGAWQLGDVDRLHQAYAEDVVFVSGVFAPPVFGWSNYLPLYQQQRARMQKVRMDRQNTFIKVSGAVGWACYQWDFDGDVDGQPMATLGQTTLVFEKRADRWLIVHNHTSAVQAAPVTGQPQGAPPANTQPTPAGKPPAW